MELNPPQLLLREKPGDMSPYITHSTLQPLFSQQMMYSSCFSSELHASASPRQRWWTQWKVIFLRETWQVYSRAFTCRCHHRVSHRYPWKGNLPSQSLLTVSCWSSPCNSRLLDWRWKAILALTTSSLALSHLTDPAWENHLCSKRTFTFRDNAKVHTSRPKKRGKSFSCAGDKAGTWHLSNKIYQLPKKIGKLEDDLWEIRRKQNFYPLDFS